MKVDKTKTSHNYHIETPSINNDTGRCCESPYGVKILLSLVLSDICPHIKRV